MMSSLFQRIQPALPWLGGLVLVACIAGLVVSMVRHMDTKPKRHVITTITKLNLPPPPPPPPPPKARPPEPQKMAEPRMREIKPVPTPKMERAPMPPPSPLTAEAGNGPSGYGLAVGNGEGDVIGGTGTGTGGGNGDASSRFGWYAGMIQTRLQRALRDDSLTRKGRFRVPVNIWIDPKGKVERTQLMASTGDGGIDAAIERVIGRVAIGEAPPADMPQPVKLRIGVQPAA